MPDNLTKIPFSRDLLSKVLDFECGDEPWETPLAAWIKADPNEKAGATYQLENPKKPLSIWLHANSKGELVGYSSLGESNWKWPKDNDPRVPISVIPYVAIARRFWGQPQNDPPKYSEQIFTHLIFEARRCANRKPLLGLYVDKRNDRAIAAYKKHGFTPYWNKWLEDDVEYTSMLLMLAPA